MGSQRIKNNPRIESLVTQRIKDYVAVREGMFETQLEQIRNSHKNSISALALYCGENPDHYIEMYELGIENYQEKGGEK